MSTLNEIMAGRSPNPDYKALVADSSDAYLLAVNLAEPAATDPGGYIVAFEGITEHAGSLNPKNAEKTYLHTGTSTTKTGNNRQFKLAGDRFSGDPFQDAILAHKMKFGVGNAIVKDYVYFNALTGKGEKGQLSILVEDDTGGAGEESATWSATLSAKGTPEEYTYAAAEAPESPEAPETP